jgi:hypothetical protein
VSATPAASLARLKLTYPTWRFERRGELYRAINDGTVIDWTTLGDMEQQLAQATWKGTSS